MSTTESGSRVQRKRGRRMQEIVAVAAELFGERGYDAVSLDDVAERLDVTKGSLYHYFSGKEELGSAAIETLGTRGRTGSRSWSSAWADHPRPGCSALVREQLIVAVRDHPAALGLFLVPDDWPEAQRAAIKELRRRHDRLFRDVVEEGVAAGGVRGGRRRHHPALPARSDDPGVGLVPRPAGRERSTTRWTGWSRR